ncbi:MAG: HupE/UreJ family protein [Gemmatimonadales bacterium]|nr:HupE/UreJ family protein [Gemmatimonadales bacterium]
MWSAFLAYASLGLRHIADLQGYDHILFVAALTGGYRPADWRRLAWLVTAFTVGHSATLALATLGVVAPRSASVEFLIPVTIVATSAFGVAAARRPPGAGGMRARYAAALGFGLVHGLGFSAFLRALLGTEESIVLPLFAFNVGLEAGQLGIVGAVLAIGAAAERLARVPRPAWAVGVALLTGLLGLRLAVARWPFGAG